MSPDRKTLEGVKHKARALERSPEVERVKAQPKVTPPPASPETLEKVKALREHMEKEGAVSKEKDEEKEVFEKEEEEEMDPRVKEAVEALEKRRKAAEARCDPMDLDDLLELDEVKQHVPIIPGKLTVCYRSLSQGDYTAWLTVCGNVGPVSMYDNEKRVISRLAMSVVSINEEILPPFRDEEGRFQEEMLNARVAVLDRKSSMVISLMDMHRRWFEDRVDKLLDDPEVIKNG